MPGNPRVWSSDNPFQPQSKAPLLRDCMDPAEGTERPVTDEVNQSPRGISFPKSTGPKTRQCPRWCSCRCHVRRFCKSPWILESAIGRIAVHYCGQRPDCNEKMCQPFMSTPVTMTYFLPQYLLRRYVTLTMQYTPLAGPKFALRAPRVTPWSHVY